MKCEQRSNTRPVGNFSRKKGIKMDIFMETISGIDIFSSAENAVLIPESSHPGSTRPRILVTPGTPREVILAKVDKLLDRLARVRIAEQPA